MDAYNYVLENMPSSITESFNGTRRDMVMKFQEIYKAPTTTNINTISNDRLALKLGLVVEELEELLEDGFGVHTYIEFKTKDGKFYSLKDALENTGIRNLTGIADAQADLAYVNDSLAIELGYNLDKVFKEVHASNMTKLDDDGNPVYRDDGKVLKGPNFIEPNIEKALNVS